MTVKDKNDRKRMKQAKTQDMQALWKNDRIVSVFA